MFGLSFSSKLDWGSCIISIAKTAFKKIGALIRSMKFLHISANLPYGLAWDTVVMSNKKQIFRNVGPSRAASLEPWAHR